MKLALSFLGQDLSKIPWNTINKNCDRVHVDLADGKFVKQQANYTPTFLTQLPIKIPIELHFMTKNPSRRFAYYAKIRNVTVVNFHIEIGNTKKIIQSARKHKLKVGLALKPETPIKELIPFLPLIDEVLLLSVNPGKSGQQFIQSTTKKIEELRALKQKIFIKVDGGINDSTIKHTKGADMVVSASYVFNQSNPEKAMQKLKQQK